MPSWLAGGTDHICLSCRGSQGSREQVWGALAGKFSMAGLETQPSTLRASSTSSSQTKDVSFLKCFRHSSSGSVPILRFHWRNQTLVPGAAGGQRSLRCACFSSGTCGLVSCLGNRTGPFPAGSMVPVTQWEGGLRQGKSQGWTVTPTGPCRHQPWDHSPLVSGHPSVSRP